MARNSTPEPVKDSSAATTEWNRDEFLAMISHEIRNSTQIIISWAELVCNRPGSDEHLRQALEVIKHNGRLQTGLLRQLLALMRQQSGDFWFDAGRILLVPVLQTAVGTMTPQALAKRIQIHAELQPSTASVIGDATQLEEVFANLLSNAIKFTPCGGEIKVRFRCGKSCAQVTVSDNGRGIGPDFLPHVFERFRQEQENSTGQDGLGLGLAIAQYLVKRHQGAIYAHSPGPGKGATFKVRLPLAPEATLGISAPDARTTPVATRL